MKNKTKILLGTLSTSLFIPFVAASCTNNDKTNVSTPENVSANPSTPVQKDPENATNQTNENKPTNPVDQNPSSEPKTPSKNNEMTQEEFDAYAENIFNNVLKVKKLTDEEKEKVIKTFAGGEWHNEKYGNQLSVSNGKNGTTLINTVLKNSKIKNAKVSIAEINDKEFSKNQFSLVSPNKLNENKEKSLQFLEANYDPSSKTLSFSFKIYNRTTKLKSSKDYSLSFDLNFTSVNDKSDQPIETTDNKNTNGTVSEGSEKDNEKDFVVNPSGSTNTDNTNNNQPNLSADNGRNTDSSSNPSHSSSGTSDGSGSASSNDSTSTTSPSVTDNNPSGDNGRNTDSSSNPSHSSSGTSDGSGNVSSSDTNTSANDTESPTEIPVS
ncbi:Uncharacterised protein [Mycoplasmopsis maculosa]|uniref:Lipoprotein n=1 Tax=Mycoplasmopsis maculosa TaxID=114885 RepID=A0A449B432_9BACT|nr:variable surface lipoprotein [Mycoplasmopsis maculosa]VEU75361.1 Uncharacterised protein [Mycoplasmopsis maculosa]